MGRRPIGDTEQPVQALFPRVRPQNKTTCPHPCVRIRLQLRKHQSPVDFKDLSGRVRNLAASEDGGGLPYVL